MQASPVLHRPSLDFWTPRSPALLPQPLPPPSASSLNPLPLSCLSVLSVTVPQYLDVNFPALPRYIHMVQKHKATSYTFLFCPLPHLQPPVPTVSSVSSPGEQKVCPKCLCPKYPSVPYHVFLHHGPRLHRVLLRAEREHKQTLCFLVARPFH